MQIWLIEDDVDIGDMMLQMCRIMGFADVRLAATLDMAWDLVHLQWRTQEPGLIISDFHLAIGTTEQYLLVLRELYPSTRVICTSSQLPPEVERRFHERGILHVKKPFQMSDLFKALGIGDTHPGS